MKKTLHFLLAVLLCAAACLPLQNAKATGSDSVAWTYPISLSSLQSKYAVLVNEDHLLDQSYRPSPLVRVRNVKQATNAELELEETVANALLDMFEAAQQVTEYTYTVEGKDGQTETKTASFPNGMTLYLKSAYRSYGTQSTIYANYLERNNGVDDGYVAKPGSSEHQSGYCADILNKKWAGLDRMNQDFEIEAEACWMKENCARFGFILRYPKDKEEVTRIAFEPWHFRYVGVEIATYIMENGLSLEEFTAESQAALQDFVSRGGDIQKQTDAEFRMLNTPPESTVLDIYGEDGDAEVTLSF